MRFAYISKKCFSLFISIMILASFVSCNQNNNSEITSRDSSQATLVDVSNDFSFYDTNSDYEYPPDDYSYPLADHETGYIYPDKKVYSISQDKKVDIYIKMNWDYAVRLGTNSYTLMKLNPGNVEKIISQSSDKYFYDRAYVGFGTEPSLLYSIDLNDYKNMEPGMYMLVVYLGTNNLKSFNVTTQFTLTDYN